MSDPGFTLYADNFMGGTMLFTDEQVGKYMRALCAIKLNGHLTFEQLNIFLKGDEIVLKKFKKDENGLYYNIRLDKEINKRLEFSNNQRDRANKRWKKECSGDAVEDAAASAGAMPDNEIGIGIGIGIGNESEIDSSSKKQPIPEHRKCSELLKKRVHERRQAKIDDKRLMEWDRDVRLMIERDNRTIEQIIELINECHDMEPTLSGFSWRDNILSMSTLRKRWNEGKISIGMNSARREKSYVPTRGEGTGKTGFRNGAQGFNSERPGYDSTGRAIGAAAKSGEFQEGFITLEGVPDHR